jgi:hypothetical protein
MRVALPLPRVSAALAAAALALLVILGATPALAHAEGGDGHTHGFDDAEFLDPIVWDGTSTVDCRAAAEGTIVWTLTGSDGVEYAELHIDEPVASVTARTGGPYVWISPLYPLDEIEADVDRIVGVLADGARFEAVACPDGGDGSGATALALPIGGGVVAGGILGLLVGSRRRSA